MTILFFEIRKDVVEFTRSYLVRTRLLRQVWEVRMLSKSSIELGAWTNTEGRNGWLWSRGSNWVQSKKYIGWLFRWRIRQHYSISGFKRLWFWLGCHRLPLGSINADHCQSKLNHGWHAQSWCLSPHFFQQKSTYHDRWAGWGISWGR